MIDAGEHPAGTRVSGALTAALDDFRRVPGRSGLHAAHEGERGGDGRVRCPAGEHDVRADPQRLLDGLVAHHGDDVRAPAECRRVQRFAGRQRMNAPALQFRDQPVGPLLAEDLRDGQV